MAVGRRGGRPGADRGTAPLASGAPRSRVLHPGRLPDADPGRAPPVARSSPAGLLRPPVSGGIPVRLGQHPPGAVGLDACRGRDRGPAADRLGARVAGPLSPAARLVVAAGGAVGLPVLPAGAVAHPVVGGGHPVPPDLHLPVPRDLGPAASAAGEQPLVRPLGRGRDRRGTPVPGTRGAVPGGARLRGRGVRRGGRPAQDRRGVPEPPRRVGAPRRADRRLRGGAPRARTDRQCLAGLGGGVGRARRQLPGPQRRPGLRRGALGGPGSEHHRHPDDLGGGSRLDRPRGGRGPHVVPLPLGCLGLAAAAGLHVGGRRPALRRSDRSGLRRGVGTDPALLRGHRAGARGRPRPGGACGDVRSPVP